MDCHKMQQQNCKETRNSSKAIQLYVVIVWAPLWLPNNYNMRTSNKATIILSEKSDRSPTPKNQKKNVEWELEEFALRTSLMSVNKFKIFFKLPPQDHKMYANKNRWFTNHWQELSQARL